MYKGTTCSTSQIYLLGYCNSLMQVLFVELVKSSVFVLRVSKVGSRLLPAMDVKNNVGWYNTTATVSYSKHHWTGHLAMLTSIAAAAAAAAATSIAVLITLLGFPLTLHILHVYIEFYTLYFLNISLLPTAANWFCFVIQSCMVMLSLTVYCILLPTSRATSNSEPYDYFAVLPLLFSCLHFSALWSHTIRAGAKLNLDCVLLPPPTASLVESEVDWKQHSCTQWK